MTLWRTLVYIDVKKLGRIPDGGGHLLLGRTVGNRTNKKNGGGYAFLHHAVDDHSWLVYSEIHSDERKETVVAFWRQAKVFFAEAGVQVRAVLTDNGPGYRSTAFAVELGPIKHRVHPALPSPDQREGGAV